MQLLSISTLISAGHLVGWVLVPLAILGAIAFALIAERVWTLARIAPPLPAGVIDRLPGSSIDDEAASCLVQLMEATPSRHVLRDWLSSLADDAVLERMPAWWIEAQLESRAPRVESSLNRGLWLLDTIVTAAPLVGLFGTVTGMMEAFQLIGANGVVNPSGVSGGVAQALIATAIGLVIAIVCLIAFNALTRHVDRTMDEIQTVGAQLLIAVRGRREWSSGRPTGAPLP